MNASDLTRGERLILARRREGRTQRQAANEHGVTIYRYGRWEREEDLDDAPQPSLGRLRDYEACLVRRLRRGITVETMSRRIGVSRWWLVQMEYGRAPADVLVAYWREKVEKAS